MIKIAHLLSKIASNLIEELLPHSPLPAENDWSNVFVFVLFIFFTRKKFKYYKNSLNVRRYTMYNRSTTLLFVIRAINCQRDIILEPSRQMSWSILLLDTAVRKDVGFIYLRYLINFIRLLVMLKMTTVLIRQALWPIVFIEI